MKKFLLSALALLAGAMTISAQSDIFDNPDNRAYLGVRASIDISSCSDDNGMFNNGFGGSIGAIYNIPIYKNLFFEPGLSMFYDTFGQSIESGDPGDMKVIDGSIRNFGFRVPLVAGYRFDLTDEISVSVFTGPQLNLSLIAREHWNGGIPERGSIFGEGGFKHFDLQWAFGMSASYQKFYVSVSGAPGLTKVYSIGKGLISFRRNLVSITLGYNF